MKHRFAFTIGLALFVNVMFSSMVSAQQSKIVEQRRVWDAALTTIEDYESYSTIGDEEVRYSFLDLFVDENVPVFNDLLGVLEMKQIPVGQYVELLSANLRNKKSNIKNIKTKSIAFENGVWRLVFSFEKIISYADKCGIFFSSEEFYGKAYKLEASLVYDRQKKQCKIESINGVMDDSKQLSHPFFAFKSEDKRDSLLQYDGTKLTLNSYRQMLFNGELNSKLFSYPDPDMLITPMVEKCNDVSLVTMKYRARKWRVKLHYDFGLGDALTLDGKDVLNSSKSRANSFGLDLGFVLPSKSMFKTGIFLGVGMTQTSMDLGMVNTDYTINTNADVDGDSYIRHYQNLKINQEIKLSELNIPIYVDFEYHFSPIVSCHLDLGARLNFDMKHLVDATTGSAYVYGVYPQYDDLRMDEHWGQNGFGNQNYSNSNLAYDELIDVSGLTVDATGSLGLRFNIPQSPWAFELSGSYLMGLTDIISTKNTTKRFIEINDKDLNNMEVITNMTEMLKGAKRQAIRMNIGVILKF